MPHLFKNVNISVQVADHLPFLQYLAAKSRGEMSRYIRDLINRDPKFQEWFRDQVAKDH